MGVVIVSHPTGLCQENWPLSFVSLVRATYCSIGLGQYTLLSGRPVQTGQVLFEFKFTMTQSGITTFKSKELNLALMQFREQTTQEKGCTNDVSISCYRVSSFVNNPVFIHIVIQQMQIFAILPLGKSFSNCKLIS